MPKVANTVNVVTLLSRVLSKTSLLRFWNLKYRNGTAAFSLPLQFRVRVSLSTSPVLQLRAQFIITPIPYRYGICFKSDDNSDKGRCADTTFRSSHTSSDSDCMLRDGIWRLITDLTQYPIPINKQIDLNLLTQPSAKKQTDCCRLLVVWDILRFWNPRIA